MDPMGMTSSSLWEIQESNIPAALATLSGVSLLTAVPEAFGA